MDGYRPQSPVAFLAGALALNAVVFAVFGNPLLKCVEMRSWARTAGVVVESRAESRFATDDEGFTRRVHAPRVRYTYEAGGTVLEGTRRRWTNQSGGEAWAERAAAETPPGTRVWVYYDPARPLDAVLDRSPSLMDWVFGVLPPVFILVPLVQIVVRRARGERIGG